jgi:hypothetical protein
MITRNRLKPHNSLNPLYGWIIPLILLSPTFLTVDNLVRNHQVGWTQQEVRWLSCTRKIKKEDLLPPPCILKVSNLTLPQSFVVGLVSLRGPGELWWVSLHCGHHQTRSKRRASRKQSNYTKWKKFMRRLSSWTHSTIRQILRHSQVSQFRGIPQYSTQLYT